MATYPITRRWPSCSRRKSIMILRLKTQQMNNKPNNTKTKLTNCREIPRKFLKQLRLTKPKTSLMPFMFTFSSKVWTVSNNSWKPSTNTVDASGAVLDRVDFVAKKKTLSTSIWLAIGLSLKLHLIHHLSCGKTSVLADSIDSADRCSFIFWVSWLLVVVLLLSFTHTS